MMFKNGFVAAIKNNQGEILRESRNESRNNIVFLPYHSNYSIRLKNNHERRSVASISIDGTDVLGSRQIIVPANGTVDVDRFCIDGNLATGNKFEFVPLEDRRVQDPTTSENGLIRIKFQLEKVPILILSPAPYPYPPIAPYPLLPEPWYDGYRWCTGRSGTATISDRTDDTGAGYTYDGTTCFAGPQTQVTGFADGISGCSRNFVGATVEGARSDQSFYETIIGELETGYTEIELGIRAIGGRPVTVTDTRKCYCFKCGTKNKFSYAFCTKCGSNLKN